ncbi:tyrosine-type recombinase/integrase [Seonamhaeicola aphaedonensis]|uniref:Site-specific recombinase XerD n=1 Tax=Seonamhaeicola aphaedonensis TaxID=1461338 RepID=A0A3D9H810_9FLAO|nr:tyrosine-type recombinase/integrase [Seonamhaeicola aphaedonensis]RED45630.1 site-specific recombinase XerD [Seonamhaeicola aphaedonensis]
MKKTTLLIPLFEKFIRESETGKRLKKNGEKITQGSIDNYKYALKNLVKFSADTGFELRICDASKLNKRERLSEKNYWKKFYKKFTDYLYKKGCYDNYVGANIKLIRTFFNYLKYEKDFNTGDYHRLFYVRKEQIDILVLSPEQLKFLIHDKTFENSLSPAMRRVKDIFVFGCSTGLRFSDLFLLTNKNFEKQQDDWYLKVKSKKTKTYSFIKLPQYAIEIYKKYKPKSAKAPIFKPISLFIFNRSLKQVGEKAQFIDPIEMTREKLGKAKLVTKTQQSKKVLRFCDKMSSHMMRRTAITTLLILGMPEHLVRKISGHSHASNSFNRYVHYAQAYIDKEIDKVYSKLDSY